MNMRNVFSKQMEISAEFLILLNEAFLLIPVCVLFEPFSMNAQSAPLDVPFFFYSVSVL